MIKAKCFYLLALVAWGKGGGGARGGRGEERGGGGAQDIILEGLV